jgi:transmembrane sensor
LIREALTFERLTAMAPDEAAACFVARRAEGLTASEEQLLAAWLAADEGHALELERADRAWGWFAGAEGHEVLDAMRAHALAPGRRSWASWPTAAMLLLLVAASVMLFLFRGPGAPGPGPGPAAVVYASAPGQVREFRLPDGSAMTLDADSRAIARGERSIELARGRAFFAVAANPSRPFTVAAGIRSVVALGTRFDVGLGAGTLTVNLLEGRVTVGPSDGDVAPVTLEPGQRFVERDGRAMVRTIGAELESATGWTRGLLHFDNMTLAEAAEQINLYSRERIVIRDPEVAAMRISGEFRAGDAMRFAGAVAELRPVRAVRRADEVELVAAR